MVRIFEELEEAKTEVEKLREEINSKSVHSENLKRAHNEQLAKIQEANSKIEKQARELNDKEDEIGATKQMYEEIKLVVKEKESLIKHLSSTNEKLRITSDERLTKWEVEKKEIVEKLEEANIKNLEKEQEHNTYKEEIKNLKSLLSVLENKCLEAEKNAKASKESGQRDDIFFKLEQESRKVEDQLKWKKEHFKHLEEAHEKLRDEFKASEKQWEKEKSTLIDDIFNLQEKLDSQTRISADFQSRLQMCHQALAHEESRIKVLELQFSETKKNFENVLSQCDDAKMEIELLTGQRDKEIASMRDLLGKKEMVYKEMEYRVGRLEQENEELRISVKEFQEAQIQEKGASSSLSKLQNKLKVLEKTHKDSLKNIRAQEAEWASKLEKMDEDFLSCKTELEKKNEIIKELKVNCEGLDRIHRDCSDNLRAKEVEWASQMEKVVENLTDCKTELERKDEIIKEFEIKCEGLDRIHRDCSENLRIKEVELASQLEKVVDDLTECKSELERKDEILKELEIKCEGLDLIHRDCTENLRIREVEWASQLEKLVEDLTECKSESERKDGIIKELEIKCEGLDRVHRDCSENLKSKEIEWASQLEKVVDDITYCKTELEIRIEVIKELEIKCEGLERAHQGCSLTFRSEEAQWTAKLDSIVADLVNCRNEMEGKNEVIRGLEMRCEALDRVHQDCSSKLKYDEDQWTTKFENMADDLRECKTKLEVKDEVIKEIEIKCEALDQANRDCSTKLRSKEVEANLLAEKLEEDFVEYRTELASKNEVINELSEKMEVSDQLYRDCLATLKTKETEWASQSVDLARDLSNSRYEVECKNVVVKQLKAEMEFLNQINGDFSAEIRAKEAEIEGKDEVMKELQMALEDSISSNIRLELQNEEKFLMLIVFKAVISDMDLKINERADEVSLLMKKLETKTENVSFLVRKIESLSDLKNELETDLLKVRYALNQANEELTENNELEFELHLWRSNAERLSTDLEEFKIMRKDLEASLLGQIQVEESLKHEKANLVKVVEEKEKLIMCLSQELEATQKESGNEKKKALYKSLEKMESLEQEWLSRELEGVIVAHMIAERDNEQEREDFQKIVRGKDRRIERKQEELNMLLKAWEKIATDELAKEVEIQEKTLVIAELEGDLENLQMRFDLQKNDLFSAKNELKEFAAEIEELKTSLRVLEFAVEKLESEKKVLFGDVNKLLSERERMLEVIGSFSDRISSLSVEDTKLVCFLEKIVGNCADNIDELYDPVKENTDMDMNSPLVKRSVDASVDGGRSPLRALNN